MRKKKDMRRRTRTHGYRKWQRKTRKQKPAIRTQGSRLRNKETNLKEKRETME